MQLPWDVKRKMQKHFTLMIVPHDSHSARSFRLPVGIGELIIGVAIVLVLGLLYGIQSYQSMMANMAELRTLRRITEEQRVELESLRAEAEEVRAYLAKLQELDAQIQQLLNDPEGPGPRSSGETQTAADGAGSVRVASATSVAIETRGQVTTASAARKVDPASVALAGLAPTFDGAALQRLGSDAVGSLLDLVKKTASEIEASLGATRSALSDEVTRLRSDPHRWPLRGRFRISSKFGYRPDPFFRGRQFHHGLDMAARTGTLVYPAGEGVVTKAGWHGAYGWTVIVDHGQGYSTLYGHNSRLLVKVGDRVELGKPIARVGSSGRSTAPHLHFELRRYGNPIDPLKKLTDSD